MNPIGRMANSKPVEIVLTALVHTIYAVVLAVSLTPAVCLLVEILPGILAPVLGWAVGAPRATTTAVVWQVLWVAFRTALVLAGSLYAYVVFGSVFQALMIRLLSLGIKAGRYPAHSVTTVRWLIYSGIYTISMRTILPLIPVTFLTNAYFRIIGCHMGRDVKLNTFTLNDAYLLTIEDGVIVGGQTDISCHLYENGHLILKPIHIGKNTLIGAHSYISPGARIGSDCIIGLYSYIRSDRVVPDGTVITSLAGIDTRTARAIEHRSRKGVARRRPGPVQNDSGTEES